MFLKVSTSLETQATVSCVGIQALTPPFFSVLLSFNELVRAALLHLTST